ncbi:uncharacterized protein LAESUDRAFT_687612 [Laetiporus sulphureus 93-53]|uniref:Dbl homology domain-containing protein n=1 Tax=Laetiporus sulphureus 93-53 TaxID=1314785 RepID=A0A165BD66_9APHY|nr:uncharacterized protein LAESUDRAFT_687612 [Laetiporus sulphureus 93-53]KZT00783.1 hypothetical protein LAESUDRAFT_687612 [Laetiporus sulphureus 93-53]
MHRRPHPHIDVTPSAVPPVNSSPDSSWLNYLSSTPGNPAWADNSQRGHSPLPRISLDVPSRPTSRASSSPGQDVPRPHVDSSLYRSTSQRGSSSLRPLTTTAHRATKSDLMVHSVHHDGESRPLSFVSITSSPSISASELSDELSSYTLESEEGLRRFQANDLPDADQEWHRLVPAAARDVLDRDEVQRQSILFEIIKSERDYVSDLVLVKEVFVDPLRNTVPMPRKRLPGFIQEVFYNLDEVRDHHQRMLGALFARQREQHPLLQSIADIITESAFLFNTAYEKYIKHYPIAEKHHRSEMQSNTKYQYFIQQCTLDPRVRKRDLVTFLSRPVTRLPRLRLLVETALLHTESNHPDVQALAIIRDILGQVISSTQPGIDDAERRVKFWELCESLEYQREEILDLDLYDKMRALVHSGPLSRRYRSEMGTSWADLHVALLDNYLLILMPEQRRSGAVVKRQIVSRPIPLEYLRLGSFTDSPEIRKEKAEEGGLFESFRRTHRPVYPMTIYHAAAKSQRRYTLYADDERTRNKWHTVLMEELAKRKYFMDNNKWFAPQVIDEHYFKYPQANVYPTENFAGRVLAATPFSSHGKNFIAVGCPSGLYVAVRGQAQFRRALSTTNSSSMVALSDFNKFLVLSDDGLSAFSLDLLGRVGQGLATIHHLEATMEPIAPQDGGIMFFRAGRIGERTMVLYVTRRLLQAHFHAVEVVGSGLGRWNSGRSVPGSVASISFRPFGEPLLVPRDAHGFTVLNRNTGICTDKGILIVNPTNPSVLSTAPVVIPKFVGTENNVPLANLKERCAGARPLGLVRCQRDEILVIYDVLGCYIDKHGNPTRSSGYLRWESKATAFLHRDEHILLFSHEFVEIRTIQTGKLVQVIEEADIRLAYEGLLSGDKSVLVAWKGREDRGVIVDNVVELVETAPLVTSPTGQVEGAWDEW